MVQVRFGILIQLILAEATMFWEIKNSPGTELNKMHVLGLEPQLIHPQSISPYFPLKFIECIAYNTLYSYVPKFKLNVIVQIQISTKTFYISNYYFSIKKFNVLEDCLHLKKTTYYVIDHFSDKASVTVKVSRRTVADSPRYFLQKTALYIFIL